ncbi:MAG TPA: epoxyqueuosine reductase QueH [Epulopiscium sp.]|nr:epoxyqueuosine reductase QueH [Candidatus Epulonipiscium sp.]
MDKTKENYQKKLDLTLEQVKKSGTVPTLLLHSCCAPCSTYVIEYLSDYFYITVFYYNPNIDDHKEYIKRAIEQQKLISKMNTKYPVKFVEGEYDVHKFLKMSKNMTDEREGGKRCLACYKLRLSQTAKYAKEHQYDYFTTTLSISPLKNASRLNEIGEALEQMVGSIYLSSDFKKKNGYKRSIELSKEHDLYRQNYCGCSYSKRDSLQFNEGHGNRNHHHDGDDHGDDCD